MYSSLKTVLDWVADTLGLPAHTWPQAETPMPFAVVNRVSGECAYPHDCPRYGVQLWTSSDGEGEALAFALCIALPSITDAHERINAVGAPEVVQIGHLDDGGFVWQVSFDLATNIR